MVSVNVQFDTTQPTQVTGLVNHSIDPIFTVGETIGDYTPVGILDGLGAYELDKQTVRVLANHELSSDLGATYTLANGTELTGARVSFFDIDKSSRTVIDAGLAYDTIINRSGEVVDDASDLEFNGIDRLCSAHYIEAHQFGRGIGLEDSMFFTGEETDGGTEFVLNPETKELIATPWLGRAAWENVTELNTGTRDKVALLIGDDRAGAALKLYVGEKDRSADASFLGRNGLANGKLYVWVSEDGDTSPTDFRGTGSSQGGQFVEIDYYRPDLAGSAVDTNGDGNIQDEMGYDAQGFATQIQQDTLGAEVGAFQFSRPEDVATNPEDGTEAVLASTGRSSLFGGVDSWGTTYKIDVDFSGSGDPVAANLNILYDGDDAGAGQFSGPDFGLRSPDNLDWAEDGSIYIQEDDAFSAFGQTSGEESSIWRLDPDSGQLTRVAQIDRTALPTGQTDSNPTDIGNWETSGILDVSELFDEAPGSLLLLDVQAHSLQDGVIASANLVQGGQLAFLEVPDEVVFNIIFGTNQSEFLKGTADADLIQGLRGRDTLRGGAGDDRLEGGDGNDSLVGGRGDDTLDGGNGQDTLLGGPGDDLLMGGNGRDQLTGGAGSDTLIGGLGPDILTGGLGADYFVLALDQGRDRFTDFNLSQDVIALANGLLETDLALISSQGNTQIRATTTNQVLAVLDGLTVNTLADITFETYSPLV
jgi:Ca2+-binding RTX toxin-like protein